MASNKSDTILSNNSKTAINQLIDSMNELAIIESIINNKFNSDLDRINAIASYLLKLGGKRIRPTLCLLIWKTFSKEKPSDKLLETAAGIELIHMATLLHDDIIDNSPLRRSQISPFKKYGSTDTLLTGDFLLTRAFGICARLDRYIVDVTEEAVTDLIEGETMETLKPINEFTIEESLTIARKKTAALFKLSCQTSAFLLGADKELIDCLASFGENLGIAFQVLDDILDVTSTEEILGKKTGIDIKEKKPSLVNMLWLDSKDPLAVELLTSKEAVSDEIIENAVNKLKNSEVIVKAKQVARSYANMSSVSLAKATKISKYNSKENFDNLSILIDYTLERLN